MTKNAPRGLELQHMQHAVALSETLNFNSAAIKCKIRQPSLTKSIQRFEQIIGVQIFERSAHFVQITPVGIQIIDKCRLVLQGVDNILMTIGGNDDPKTKND